MPFLSSIYTFIGVALVSLIAGAWGGYSYEAAKFDAFKAQVEVNARVQQELNRKDIQEAQQVNTETVNAYAKTIAGIHAYYQSSRVLNPNPTGGKLPQISIPTLRTHEAAGNHRIGKTLEEQCADTTAQLMALQDWVKAQGVVYGE